jgi:phosphoglycolate phosphatase-like HAD superfamily hydrolase
MIKAVIFDFDDTLCMTEEVCFHIENEVLRHMNRPSMPRGIHRSTWNVGMDEGIAQRSPGINVSEFRDLFNKTRDEYIKSKRIDIVPDSNLEELDKLIDSGKLVMILTSRNAEDAKNLTHSSHPIGSRMVAFYHKDNNAYSKPDSRAFGVFEEAHGLMPPECIYVGDAPSDGVAAKGAGLFFIACLESGLVKKGDFDGIEVDKFIVKLSDVIKAVQEIESELKLHE